MAVNNKAREDLDLHGLVCGAEAAPADSPESRMKTSLMAAIETIQADAAALKPAFRELGVFLFFFGDPDRFERFQKH